MSCSLDAVLLMALRVQQELGDESWRIMENAVDPCVVNFRTMVANWCTTGAWRAWSQSDMDHRRDSIRELLKDGELCKATPVEITQSSSVHDIIYVFILKQLSGLHFELELKYRCNVASCHSKNKKEGISIESIKKWDSAALSVYAAWSHNSSTQAMINRLVSIPRYCL